MKKLIPLIVLGFTLSIFPQKGPEPKLVLEFSRATCDELITYVDILARPLNADRASKALAIFHPKKSEPWAAIHYAEFLLWSGHRFGDNRPKIVWGQPESETRVEFWIIPPGGIEPGYKSAKPGAMFDGVKRAFVYNTEFGGEMCPAVDPRLIAEILAGNPGVGLKVVVRGKTGRYRIRKINKWLRQLVTVERISRQRIRFIMSNRLSEDYPYQDVEFWFVPSGKGR